MEFQKTVFALTPEQALEAERAALRARQDDVSVTAPTPLHPDGSDVSVFGPDALMGLGGARSLSHGPSYDDLPTIGHISRYALKYHLGEGGLGTVYAAHDPLLSRLVAIKTLSLELSPEAREQFNAMFLNEARAAGGLNHPHIVTVFDAGTSPQGAYIAMELLKGKDLRQLLKEGWRPTPVEAALIIRRVADALSYAHSRGVVHRDVKPANIFMVGRTQPKVLDFGIARVASTQDGSGDDDYVAGSPYYMAPEQVRHAPVDRRCDVFSLGVVFYELLTGVKPFQGSTLTEIATAVVTRTPPLAETVNRQVPPALSAIASRAMEKAPEDRYRSARLLSRELRHWLDEQAEAAQHDERQAADRRHHRKQWALGGLAAGLVVAVIGVSLGDLLAPHAPAGSLPEAKAAAGVPAVAPAQAASSVLAAASAAAELPASITLDPSETLVAGTVAVASAAVAGSAADSAAPAPEAQDRTAAAVAAASGNGQVNLAVSPWGQVEVDGVAAGTVPPLTRLTLPAGRHTITIRNQEFPPHSVTVNVTAGQPVTIRHRFGS
ncbi:serine/threonine-protein kinase [Caldimonas brevitalea]|uniref:non-specific serine/threonine protein kinase n=1 Tax=Caldimonas brevitalea TaxID=413882 RepID=A0A0G3BFN0_9BURK|nr:serine/threonine-protein kinase [Caldimonas brevitalea]AKJ28127.1 serine/threonine protein kinase [Caldimonas brevitalea]